MPEEPRDLVPIEQTVPVELDLSSLLPTPSLNGLTASEGERFQQFQAALVHLGQAAGGCLVCPGNQVGVIESNKCPYAAKCELLKLQKAPAGELCPIERELTLSRFTGWCQTIGANPSNLREDQRAVVAELTWIDVQEQRCTNILSRGEAARLTQINVKDSHPETGEWISWERVIHSNAVLLESLHTRKRMIMKEWMLTPEQKFKAAKALGKLGSADDLSKTLSSRADKMRNLDVTILDAEYTDSE
jgi:hypothetical protein